ncbi:MAG: shikimate kinase [Clostridia bacterium]|nr:shikimate kinase [Clostridia bacterium]
MDKQFGLLGRKLSHSFSPQIHRYLGDYEYLLYEKEPEQVEEFVRYFPLDGFNVTIPYKETVMPFCTSISEEAQKIGSVNTVVRRGGKIFGYNTDYFGFSFLLENAGIDPAGQKAIVLGSGGASKTAQAVLRDLGASSVTVIGRNLPDNYENIEKHYDAGIIVNATPVGMYPNNGERLLDLSRFTDCRGALDMIYNPARTALLLDAERLGVKNTNGLVMLVAQAKKAAEIFLDTRYDDALIGRITSAIERETKNIALIGMPGCGKSSIGKTIARLTGRPLIETDEMIPERAGKSIKEIFAEDGEDVFRKIETACLADASKKSGCVIATGGGVVTRPENLDLLRQNSVIVFLDRDFSALPLKGRPLSQKYGVEELARARMPLYNAWCDLRIENSGVQNTARRIIKELKLKEGV